MAIQMMEASKLELNSNDVPEIKDWKVGEKYKLEVSVQMVESELEMEGKICSEFIIKKVKVL